MMGFGWIIILFIAALVFSRALFPNGSADRLESAIDIAGERYAKGDLSKEEFDQIKQGLGG